MKNVEDFLAHAIKLELDAANRFDELAASMQSFGNAEVGRFFELLASYARLHLADAQARAGFRELPDFATYDFQWPGLESPECAEIWAADPMIAKRDALETALASEESSRQFYATIAETTKDPEIRLLAEEFAEEEAEHVAILERWMAGDERMPEAGAEPAKA